VHKTYLLITSVVYISSNFAARYHTARFNNVYWALRHGCKIVRKNGH